MTSAGVVQAARVRHRWWRTRRARVQLAQAPGIDLDHRARYAVPGVAHVSDLYRSTDVLGRAWALLYVPSTGHGSVVLDCALGELDLRDPRIAQRWVAELGLWLAMLTQEPDVAACTLTLDRLRAGGCPPAGARDTSPGEGMRARVQLTVRTLGPHGRSDVHGIATEVGARIPLLLRSVAEAGIGQAAPAPPGAVAAVIAGAYLGEEATVPREFTPAAREEWGHLRHGAPSAAQDTWPAASITWSLSQLASAVVLTQALPQLLASAPTQTRVSLIYQRRISETSPMRPDPAHQTWSGLPESLEGAAAPPLTAGGIDVPRFGMLVTATTRPGRLRAAAQELAHSLDTPLRPWLRPLYGAQAAGFAAGLPLGLMLRRHTGRPRLLHEATRPSPRVPRGTTPGRS